MPIEDMQTQSLDEFWDIISPDSDFINKIRNPIFRGQGDAEWALTPTVLRHEVISKYRNEHKTHTYIDHVVFLEHHLLHNFLHFSDEMGFTIPNDSLEFRKHMDFFEFTNRYGEDATGWPSKEYLSFLALAQHHGIPTRLMDWSKHPLVAAYFAASQSLNLTEAPNNLAVWILDTYSLKQTEGTLEYVTLPGSTSNNLAAQKGVFLVHRQQHGMSRNSSFAPEDLKYVVNNILEENKDCKVYKITLPSKLAGNLLHRLNKFGISAATLFPSLDGAARAALEFKIAKKRSGLL